MYVWALFLFLCFLANKHVKKPLYCFFPPLSAQDREGSGI